MKSSLKAAFPSLILLAGMTIKDLNMEAEYAHYLKEEVERKIGRRILSSADCHQLCEEISKWTQAKIGFNTVRRFFSLMKAEHHPSLYTLNTFSVYCGFSSYDDFVKNRSRKPATELSEGSGLLNYLVMLFKYMEVVDVNDATYFNLVQHTINFLEQHTYLIDRFQKEIAQTRNGQLFYFEQFIHIDRLNTYYGEGLQYYLSEKKGISAQLFARSLLCFKSWLAQNDEQVRRHHALLQEFAPDKNVKPSICARYLASFLFDADIRRDRKEPIMIKARQMYASIVPHKEHYSSFYCFEIILSEALILTGEFEEALFYIDELFVKLKRYVPSYIDVVLLETIGLYKAIVYAHTGKKTKAAELLSELVPHRFCFLSKQYLTILYVQLKRFIRNSKSDQEQLQHLIQQTGFSRLDHLWQNASVVSELKYEGNGDWVGKSGQVNNVATS